MKKLLHAFVLSGVLLMTTIHCAETNNEKKIKQKIYKGIAFVAATCVAGVSLWYGFKFLKNNFWASSTPVSAPTPVPTPAPKVSVSAPQNQAPTVPIESVPATPDAVSEAPRNQEDVARQRNAAETQQIREKIEGMEPADRRRWEHYKNYFKLQEADYSKELDDRLFLLTGWEALTGRENAKRRQQVQEYIAEQRVKRTAEHKII